MRFQRSTDFKWGWLSLVAGAGTGAILFCAYSLLRSSLALHDGAKLSAATHFVSMHADGKYVACRDAVPLERAANDARRHRIQVEEPATEKLLKNIFSRLPKLSDVPPDSNVFLTFSNGHYSEFMLNTAALVAELGYPIVVLTFDKAAKENCEWYGIPYISSEEELDTSDFRQDRSNFLLMGAQKPLAVLRLFDQIQARTVALIDSDTIWLRDPFPWLEQHPDADVFVTTDCLSHEYELAYVPNRPRCGHIGDGLGFGWAMNTGITIWRDREGTRQFAREWNEFMSRNELHVQGVDDQWSFNVLMTVRDEEHRPKKYPLSRVPSDPRVFYAAPGDAVKLMVLPSALFAGGKTMFYSHLPQKYGTEPYVVHATFQRYNNNGKRARFRESHAYLLDPPAYYSEGTFLVYENLVHDFMRAVISLASKPLTQVHKHIIALSYQLSVFRDAAGMARVLNRTLILPKVYAWCDVDSAPTIMAACHIEGAEQDTPFHAPGDVLFNMDVLEDGTNYLPWRAHNFLTHPSTPLQLRWATDSLWYHFPGAQLPELFGAGAHMHSVTESQLRAVAATVLGARVLRIQNAQPGMFLSFDDDANNSVFNTWFDRMMYDLKWCCSTQIGELKRQRFDSMDLMAPLHLKTDAASTDQVPRYKMPAYCDDARVMKQLQEELTQPLQYENHPCNFLRDPPVLPTWGADMWKLMQHVDADCRS